MTPEKKTLQLIYAMLITSGWDGDALKSVVPANLQRATRLRQSIFPKASAGGLST